MNISSYFYHHSNFFSCILERSFQGPARIWNHLFMKQLQHFVFIYHKQNRNLQIIILHEMIIYIWRYLVWTITFQAMQYRCAGSHCFWRQYIIWNISFLLTLHLNKIEYQLVVCFETIVTRVLINLTSDILTNIIDCHLHCRRSIYT